MKTNTNLLPYIFFSGRCEEAIEFYCQVVGAEVQMKMRYEDAPPGTMDQQCDGTFNKKSIMHARLGIGDSTLLLSDGPGSGKYDGFSLTLRAADPAEAQTRFNALSAGGKVDMPLTKTFWSPAFGMLTDRFGVKWFVIVEGASAA